MFIKMSRVSARGQRKLVIVIKLMKKLMVVTEVVIGKKGSVSAKALPLKKLEEDALLWWCFVTWVVLLLHVLHLQQWYLQLCHLLGYRVTHLGFQVMSC